MKVGLLTVHKSVNAGASLQACGLYRTLEDLGHDVTVVDYCPPYFPDYTRPIAQMLSEGPRGLAKVVAVGGRAKAKAALFREFAESCYPRVTERFESCQSRGLADLGFDAFVCGSDQIWNPPHVRYDDAWLFGFLPGGGARVVSYAASVGLDRPSGRDLEWLAGGLGRFDALSVREDSAVDLLRGLGFEAEQCIDPTFLRSAEEWRALSRKPAGDIPDRFVFYYPLEENPLEAELVEATKGDLGLKCVAAWSALRNLPGVDAQVPVYGPREFLWLVDNADAVVTNSFHGLAFSVIFGKPLVSYRNLTRNSRLSSMFRLLGMEDYQVSSMEEYSRADWEARFSRMRSALSSLDSEVVRSRGYLERALA